MLSLNISKKEGSVNQNNKSFTLTEMVVVMAIILMIALLIYPAITTAIKKGEGSQCVNPMTQRGTGLTMHLQDYGRYPDAVRYAVQGEEGSIIDSLGSYIDNARVFICPSSEESFKEMGLSYIYNTEAEDNMAINQWLLVDARLPGNSNPHLGDRATVLWADGHAKLEEVILPE